MQRISFQLHYHFQSSQPPYSVGQPSVANGAYRKNGRDRNTGGRGRHGRGLRLFPLCFGIIALGIHSKRPDMINFSLHYGLELFGSQSRCPCHGPGLLVSGQHSAMASCRSIPPDTRGRSRCALDVSRVDADIMKGLDVVRALLH
jgi:hypothetical protein